MESVTGFKKFLKSKTFTLLILLVFFIILFTILSGGSFVSVANFTNILNIMVIVSFLTIGEAFLLIMGHIDLSLGYVGTMSAIVMCIAISYWHLPWFLGVIVGVGMGIVCGLLNAVMINVLNFQSFIATLAMSSVTQGLTYVFSQGAAIPLESKVLTALGRNIGGVIPASVILALVALVIYGIILSKTKVGRTMYLCGGNAQAARLAGLNPKKYLYIMFANGGAMAAVAGGIAAARLTRATTGGVSTYQFSGITAAILGGISFGGGSGNMMGCFLGLCILNSFTNAMQILKVSSFVQTIFSGLLLLIALLFDNFTLMRNAKKQLAATKEAASK